MKRLPIAWPAPRAGEKTYWRSLDQLADTPQFQEFLRREFPAGASELSSPISRRSFMTLMGASLGLAGLSGCRRPEEKILPYAKAPEQSVMGLPTYYATTMTLGAQAIGLLVESNEGRPTKIEGNPHHPQSLGATSVFAQASILELYDPERSSAPLVDGKDYSPGATKEEPDDESRKAAREERKAGYEAAAALLVEKQKAFAQNRGTGLRILSGAVVSPTMLRLRDQLLSAMPEARWHTWEPICDDQVRAGSRLAFGDDLHAQLKLEHADVILSLDSDFLGQEPDALRNAREFADRRRVESSSDTMNRLYVVEAAWSITGASSDHRLRVRPSEVGQVALQLAAELSRLGVPLPKAITDALPQGQGQGKTAQVDDKFVAALCRDLVKSRGRCVIAVGRNQPKEVHALVHVLNSVLGAVGTTLQYIKQPDAGRKLDRESLTELMDSVDRGEVDTLVVLGTNPVYDAPADLKLRDRLTAKKDRTALWHLGTYRDETADLARVHIPQAHFLEAWGDAIATDGTLSMVQPLIAPLYEGWSDIELVGLLVKGDLPKGYELVRDTWRSRALAEEEAEQAALAAQQAQLAAALAKSPQPGTVAAAKVPATAPAAPGTPAPAATPATPATLAPPAGAAPPTADPKTPAAPAAGTGTAAAGAVQQPATTETAAPAGPAGSAAPAAAAVAGSGVALTDQPSGPSAFELFFDRSWRKTLHDGLIHDSALPPVTPMLNEAAVGGALSSLKASAPDAFEVVFLPDPKMYDGRYANNGWLQELPDPITKMVWDNAALMSPRTAKGLGVVQDDIVKIDLRGRSLEAAVFVQVGQAERTISLSLGYGRKSTGIVGRHAGFNAYLIRDSAALGFDSGAQISGTGRTYDNDPRDRNFVDIQTITGLVTTQDHFSMEGRPLIREASLTKFRKEPDFAKHAVHHPPLRSLWDDPGYAAALTAPKLAEKETEGKTEGAKNGEKPEVPQKSGQPGHELQQWGLAIDLSACIGCGACTIACQAENNISIVGKAQVRKGREMHWIRVDRYFSGDEDNPEALQQPVTCMQCENAPCENVCPVGATVHSGDGLNDMVYNRCIGTRYCQNNCPYKVRRFNFLDWRGDVQEVAKLKYNPDVSLRSRGVMEKCTYCVQRIRGAQRDATLKGMERVMDGVITPACAQVCPAEAIVFGDITDPNSRVSRIKGSQRDYTMLAELNIKPRTSYLARIRNLNPELAEHE